MLFCLEQPFFPNPRSGDHEQRHLGLARLVPGGAPGRRALRRQRQSRLAPRVAQDMHHVTGEKRDDDG